MHQARSASRSYQIQRKPLHGHELARNPIPVVDPEIRKSLFQCAVGEYESAHLALATFVPGRYDQCTWINASRYAREASLLGRTRKHLAYPLADRKSTRLNSSHLGISYA